MAQMNALVPELKYLHLPKLDQWKKDSFVGTIFSPRRQDDKALIWIDALVAQFHKSQGSDMLFVLKDLYYATKWWRDHYLPVNPNPVNPKLKYITQPKLPPTPMDARREPAIRALFEGTEYMLEYFLDCPQGTLPRKLKELYGTGMAEHGVETDTIDVQKRYLTHVDREKFRVYFRQGLAYGFRADIKGTPHWEPIDNSTVTMGVYPKLRYGEGFVMRASGDLYVVELEGYISYHSYFTGGKPVLCAGTITIKRGQIVEIKNDSGHYQPPASTLQWMLRTLQFNGVRINKILVHREPKFVGAPTLADMYGDKFLRLGPSQL